MYSWGLYSQTSKGWNTSSSIHKNSVLIQDIAWKNCWERWTIETSGERDFQWQWWRYIYIYKFSVWRLPFQQLLHRSETLLSLDCSILPLILTLYEASSTISWIFYMTWPETETWSAEPLANTLTIIYIYIIDTPRVLSFLSAGAVEYANSTSAEE